MIPRQPKVSDMRNMRPNSSVLTKYDFWRGLPSYFSSAWKSFLLITFYIFLIYLVWNGPFLDLFMSIKVSRIWCYAQNSSKFDDFVEGTLFRPKFVIFSCFLAQKSVNRKFFQKSEKIFGSYINKVEIKISIIDQMWIFWNFLV